MNSLQATNPELFYIRPRLGGFITTTVNDSLKNDICVPSTINDKSRTERITEIQNNQVNLPTQDEILAKRRKMLSATLSCVMLLASKDSDIERNQLQWAQNYLNCIIDEFGRHPPNIQGILNHLKTFESGSRSADD